MPEWSRKPGGPSNDTDRLLEQPRSAPVRKRHRDSASSLDEPITISQYSSTDEDDTFYSEKFSLGAHRARKVKHKDKRRQRDILDKIYGAPVYGKDGKEMWATTRYCFYF